MEIVTPTDFHIFQRDSNHQPVYGIFIHINYHTFMMFGVWFLYAMEQMGYLISGDGRLSEEPFGPGSSRANLRDAAWWSTRLGKPWKTTRPHYAWLGLVASCSKWFAFSLVGMAPSHTTNVVGRKQIRSQAKVNPNWYFNWRLRGRLAFRKATHPCSKKQLGKDFSIYLLPVLERMNHICLKLANNNNDTIQGA